MGHRQAAEADGIEKLKNRRVGADAQGQRADRSERKGRALTQGAQCKPDVLQCRFQPNRAPRGAALLLHRVHAAEFEASLPACLLFAHSGSDVVGDLLIEVKAKLVVEALFELSLFPKPLPPLHDDSPSASWRTRPTASESRCQLSVSARSWLRALAGRRQSFSLRPCSAS